MATTARCSVADTSMGNGKVKKTSNRRKYD